MKETDDAALAESTAAAVAKTIRRQVFPVADPIGDELECLWADLARELGSQGWSSVAEDLVARIVRLSLSFARPTPWEQVDPALVDSGMYARILTAAGVPFIPRPTPA